AGEEVGGAELPDTGAGEAGKVHPTATFGWKGRTSQTLPGHLRRTRNHARLWPGILSMAVTTSPTSRLPKSSLCPFAQVNKEPIQAAATKCVAGCVVGYSATFTSKVTLFSPGPRLRTSNLNFPSFAGVNFTSHFGPGLVSLPASF